ncbi:hypothetical protein M407DRAFT_98478 [Tulasnella calospora MUT 4182]|uniref:Uncharacterized protein n=1 Tax=Tulasnella calospora MUT 4182 TaxID=1051891 RepID=A0A0C3QGP4_9AGAM|nr:hypothetical protein M407DRAFT_98478 [Tulasnella calospora MUT 4182]
MCVLVLPPAFSQWKNTGTDGVDILSVLIRDSPLWYFCLGGCLLFEYFCFFTNGKVSNDLRSERTSDFCFLFAVSYL